MHPGVQEKKIRKWEGRVLFCHRQRNTFVFFFFLNCFCFPQTTAGVFCICIGGEKEMGTTEIDQKEIHKGVSCPLQRKCEKPKGKIEYNFFFFGCCLFLEKEFGQWRLHNCGNTTDGNSLLQQFIKTILMGWLKGGDSHFLRTSCTHPFSHT